ncbi:MAG: class I SAM-dependent methyltransferase [Anditalea sp.]
MKKPVSFYDKDIKSNPNQYSGGHYVERNRKLSEMLLDHNPKVIFELAGAEGNFAYHILKSPNIERYTFTDFSNEALKIARKEIGNDERVEFLNFDAENYKDLKNYQFDTFVCNSLEHFNNDIPIIEALRSGTVVCLCLPNFDWEGHVRSFRSFEEIKDRYGNYLDFKDVHEFEVSYSARKIFQRLRAFIFKKKYSKLISLFLSLLGLESIGNKRKWNIVALKK